MSAARVKPLPPQLAAAVATLQAAVRTPTPARCWGCGDYKLTSPRWKVGAYLPSDARHPLAAYLVCPTCAASRSGIERAALAVETHTRSLAEERRAAP